MVGIPATPSLIVGRESEIAAVTELLLDPQVRLLTLLGPAGVGKTRLALEVASRLTDAFDDGVAFIDLTPIDEPARLPKAIATAVGIEEGGGEPLDDLLKRFFSHRTMLLVLDNFEQIEAAGPTIAQLLSAAPGLKAIVTSRVPLQVTWETTLPCPTPRRARSAAGPGHRRRTGDVSPCALHTARRSDPARLQADGANYRAVAEICIRLDGLPLALELAAAHVDTRSLDDILGGLRDSGLELLVSGARDLPERHQTLRAAIEWSERLLDKREHEMFMRLAAFSGTFTADAARRRLPGGARYVTETLESLVRKNLVRFEAGTGRYRLLEMIREFALGRLSDAGLEEETRLRHLQWFLALAEAAEPHLRRHEQKSWMDRLEADHDNFRSALGWCLRTGRLEEGSRLAAALGWFWNVRSHFAEGIDWYEAFFSADEGTTRARPRTLMRAFKNAGWLAHMRGRPERRLAYAEECHRLADELGDDAHRCWALLLKARAYGVADPVTARELLQESLVAALSADDESCLRWTYHSLGVVSQMAGDYQRAIEESSKALELHREAGDAHFLLWTLGVLGRAEIQGGHFELARQRFREAIVVARDLPSLAGLESALLDLARLANAEENFELALFLVGIADRVHERSGSNIGARYGAQDFLPSTLTKLGESRAAAARTMGHSMGLDESLALALSDDPFELSPQTATFDPLSAREIELATLIAQGLSNRQIADQLVISVHTVERHVSNILAKLALSSRSQIAVWMTERTTQT